MSRQVTLTLRDETFQRAERFAQATRRALPEILAETIELSLPSLGSQPGPAKPLEALSDDEVLALVELQLDAKQDKRLSELLDGQQAGTLTAAERTDLFSLMQLYQAGLLRKAQALHEAVRRGLREPLRP